MLIEIARVRRKVAIHKDSQSHEYEDTSSMMDRLCILCLISGDEILDRVWLVRTFSLLAGQLFGFYESGSYLAGRCVG